tara:strand:- start:2918 stop:3433 length:516 start_codon:yes stop_codon:yes gene_type:complete
MWQNKIVGSGTEAPDQLLANPFNWRVHPKAQQDVMTSILSKVGWVQNVIVNQNTGHVVDGHMRASVAISNNEKEIPVIYVDLTEQEEKAILSVLDPIGAMAGTDREMLDSLVDDVSLTDDALAELIASVTTKDFSLQREHDSPEEFEEFDEHMSTDYSCPKCHYAWSGKAK